MREGNKVVTQSAKIGKAVLCESTKFTGPVLFRICAGKKVLVDLTSARHFILNGQKKILVRFTSIEKPWLKPEEVNADYLFHRDPNLHAFIKNA